MSRLKLESADVAPLPDRFTAEYLSEQHARLMAALRAADRLKDNYMGQALLEAVMILNQRMRSERAR